MAFWDALQWCLRDSCAVDPGIAEHGLHDRARLAFSAARAAALPGCFLTVETAGLRALVTTSPGLGFLNSVTGVTEASIEELPDVLSAFTAAGAPPPSLTTGHPTAELGQRLRDLGFTPAGHRPLAVIDLPVTSGSSAGARDGLRVTEVVADEVGVFLDVLAAGYDAPRAVRDFLLAEHSAPGVLRFLAWRGDEPVAAAGMSLHGGLAVLGGAAVVPAARGLGGQSVLLQHRLKVAQAAGCVAAAATAAPSSPSARNLARAGFTVQARPQWRRPTPIQQR